MLPDYTTLMIARQEHEEQIKKAAYQRAIRSITNPNIISKGLLQQAYQKGTPVKQLMTFFVTLAALVVVLAGCGGETVAEAKPAQPEAGAVVAALPQASTKHMAQDPAEIEPVEAAKPAATPLPQAPTVIQLSGYQDGGTFHIVGTLLNNTDTVITDLELAVSAKDAKGKSLLKDFFGEVTDQATFYPKVAIVQPGQAVPFSYIMSAEAEPATYEVTVGNYLKSEAPAVAVEVQNGQMVISDWGSLYLVGEFVNTGTAPVEISGFLGAVFNIEEEIIDVAEPLASGFYLAPAGAANGQDRAPFRIQVNSGSGRLDEVESWGVYPAAAAVEARQSYNLTLSEPVVYEDEAGGVHLLGTITNNEQTPLTVYLVGGLYAADGTVVDGDFNDLPFYAIAPGQTLPFELSDFDAASSGTEGNVEIDHATVMVDWRSTGVSDDQVIALATQNDTTENNGSVWSIKGEVLNTSDKAMANATVVVALYDAENKVVGLQYAYAYPEADAIEPNGFASYNVTIYASPELDPATVTVKTFVEGSVAQ